MFTEKVICDNIHGSIGISSLEQQLINTRTFQRLKKIKQLGLASFVFPGAEHSRFAHSIGVLHVMSKMVDRLRTEGCDYVASDEVKQKLRIAALLHDIGHYPLSHIGEQAFQWLDALNATQVTADSVTQSEYLLSQAAEIPISEAASHERIGEIIITNDNSEIKKILVDNDLDPNEIARIINGEDEKNRFYVQLLSSTLDCDRLDYLLRDSLATGTKYGSVDIDYIISNLKWDKNTEFICFNPKAINAIEHFIMARYFSYNITYHKTIVGFELMAKALLFMMIQDTDLKGEFGPIVRSATEIQEKIKTDTTFLANFNDEYFWYFLERWNPKDEICKKLKHNLLNRIPLRPIYDLREVFDLSNKQSSIRYVFLRQNLLNDIYSHNDYSKKLNEERIGREHLCVLDRKIRIEAVSYHYTYEQDAAEDDKKLKLAKILYNEKIEDLVASPGSIIRVLSDFELRITRLYALLDKSSNAEAVLSSIVDEIVKVHDS